MRLLLCIFFSNTFPLVCYATDECFKLDTSIIQKVEHEGFHRELRWLIESLPSSKLSWNEAGCNLSLKLQISNGMYVNPDEVAELNRTGKLRIHVEGFVDIEAPAHEATEHVVYVFLNSSSVERNSVNLPFHLRYQRGQIVGGYGKVELKKPNLLVWCPDSLNRICGRGLKVEAPCDETAHAVCLWKDLSYEALFDDFELLVPVGNLDDYPLVSIVTLLLGCAGCIYILSVLSSSPL